MKPTHDNVNRDLLALTECFANASIGPAEFRRRRRDLVCSWTGEVVPLPAQAAPSEDDTHPALKAITDEDIAAAAVAVPADKGVTEAPGKSVRWGWWVTGLLLVFAASGAGALLWFVLRRSV